MVGRAEAEVRTGRILITGHHPCKFRQSLLAREILSVTATSFGHYMYLTHLYLTHLYLTHLPRYTLQWKPRLL
jgi:hypothetical protein